MTQPSQLSNSNLERTLEKPFTYNDYLKRWPHAFVQAKSTVGHTFLLPKWNDEIMGPRITGVGANILGEIIIQPNGEFRIFRINPPGDNSNISSMNQDAKVEALRSVLQGKVDLTRALDKIDVDQGPHPIRSFTEFETSDVNQLGLPIKFQLGIGEKYSVHEILGDSGPGDHGKPFFDLLEALNKANAPILEPA